VKLWDKDDQESPSSAVATFDTGLSKTDWTASFIWDGTANENNFAYFRKGFTLTKPVKLAKVFTSAHNDSILHLNGANSASVPPARTPQPTANTPPTTSPLFSPKARTPSPRRPVGMASGATPASTNHPPSFSNAASPSPTTPHSL
jgi:hypothetical protein